MKQLVIDRSEWCRGQGDVNSKLLKEDGQKCCLGFLCLADNIPSCVIWRVSMLNKAKSTLTGPKLEETESFKLLVNSVYSPTTFALTASTINDEILTKQNNFYNLKTEEDREKLLIELFAEKGIELSFIN